MLNTSDLVIKHQNKEQGRIDKTLNLITSSLSLDLADTACSIVVNLISDTIIKRINIAKWDEQIVQCIRATDSASMSQREINILKDTVKEKLNETYIDVQKLIRDENYLNKLASDIADHGDEKESERLSRILNYLLHILSGTLRKSPEFLAELHVVVTEHEHIIKKHNTDIHNLIKEVKALKSKPSDVESLLQELPTLKYSNEKPFAYNNCKLTEIYGRDTHLTQLSAFADDMHRFLFWVVSGPAGIGKSKLVFHFGCLYQRKDWMVRYLDRSSIQELCNMNNWDISKDILLIIDYANEQNKIATLLSKLCRFKENRMCRKIRVILIAREGTMRSSDSLQIEYPQWYIDITKEIRIVNNFIYFKEFMNLQGLSIEECNNLHQSYAEKYLMREELGTDKEIVKQLLEKEVLDEKGFARPLYVLFVIDSYYNAPQSSIWNLDYLQSQIYERDWNNWREEIDAIHENVFLSFSNVLIYATIFGRWQSDTTLPEPLSADCNLINTTALQFSTDYKSLCFRILTGKTCIEYGTSILVCLTPDMIGEYYVMKRLSVFDNETLSRWATLISHQLVNGKDFWVRAIQDFSNHEDFVFTFLKLLNVISQKVANCDKETHKAFSFILETFFRNYKGNEDDKIYREILSLLNRYVGEHMNTHESAAELALLFHINKPHMGSITRIRHLKRIELLYSKWPNSHKIASTYISFLGDIVASRIGAHSPGYSDLYIEKFIRLLSWADSTDYEIQKTFITVLLKNIERANKVYDWDKSSLFEDDFLKTVIKNCSDELLIDCIEKYDSVIISLAIEKNKAINTINSLNEELIRKIDLRLEKAIDFFKYIIDSNTNPTFNFTWTYVSKLAMITKNLFINQCSPHKELLFKYMIHTLQKVYNEYYFSNENSILSWHVSQVIDGFCDSKSYDIPWHIKAQCIFKKPNVHHLFTETP